MAQFDFIISTEISRIQELVNVFKKLDQLIRSMSSKQYDLKIKVPPKTESQLERIKQKLSKISTSPQEIPVRIDQSRLDAELAKAQQKVQSSLAAQSVITPSYVSGTMDTKGALEFQKRAKGVTRVLTEQFNTLNRNGESLQRWGDRVKKAQASLNAFSTSIGKMRARVEQANGPFNRSTKNLNNNQRAVLKVERAYSLLNAKLGGVQDQYNRVAGAERRVAREQERLAGHQQEFNHRLGLAIGKLIRYRVAFAAMQGVARAFTGTFKSFIELEAGLADVAKVLNPLGAQLEHMQQLGFELSQTFGVAIGEIVKAMKVWAQTGLRGNDVIEATTATLLAQNAVGISALEATEALTAAIFIYGVEASKTTEVIDKWISVQAKYPVSAKDLANALKRVGSAAVELGIDMDHLNAIVATIGSVTRKTGTEVGTSLKTILARLPRDQTIGLFNSIGVASFKTTGEMRKMQDVIEDLAERWKTLNDVQRRNVAQQLGGVRRYVDVLALLNNYGIAQQAVIDSEMSFGAATQAAQYELQTFGNELKRMQALFAELSEAVGSELIGSFAVLVGILTDLGKFTKENKGIAKLIAGFSGMVAAVLIAAGVLTGFKFLLSKVHIGLLAMRAGLTASGGAMNRMSVATATLTTTTAGLSRAFNVLAGSLSVISLLFVAGLTAYSLIWGRKKKLVKATISETNAISKLVEQTKASFNAHKKQIVLLKDLDKQREKIIDSLERVNLTEKQKARVGKELEANTRALANTTPTLAIALAQVGDSTDRAAEAYRNYKDALDDVVRSEEAALVTQAKLLSFAVSGETILGIEEKIKGQEEKIGAIEDLLEALKPLKGQMREAAEAIQGLGGLGVVDPVIVKQIDKINDAFKKGLDVEYIRGLMEELFNILGDPSRGGWSWVELRRLSRDMGDRISSSEAQARFEDAGQKLMRRLQSGMYKGSNDFLDEYSSILDSLDVIFETHKFTEFKFKDLYKIQETDVTDVYRKMGQNIQKILEERITKLPEFTILTDEGQENVRSQIANVGSYFDNLADNMDSTMEQTGLTAEKMITYLLPILSQLDKVFQVIGTAGVTSIGAINKELEELRKIQPFVGLEKLEDILKLLNQQAKELDDEKIFEKPFDPKKLRTFRETLSAVNFELKHGMGIALAYHSMVSKLSGKAPEITTQTAREFSKIMTLQKQGLMNLAKEINKTRETIISFEKESGQAWEEYAQKVQKATGPEFWDKVVNTFDNLNEAQKEIVRTQLENEKVIKRSKDQLAAFLKLYKVMADVGDIAPGFRQSQIDAKMLAKEVLVISSTTNEIIRISSEYSTILKKIGYDEFSIVQYELARLSVLQNILARKKKEETRGEVQKKYEAAINSLIQKRISLMAKLEIIDWKEQRREAIEFTQGLTSALQNAFANIPDVLVGVSTKRRDLEKEIRDKQREITQAVYDQDQQALLKAQNELSALTRELDQYKNVLREIYEISFNFVKSLGEDIYKNIAEQLAKDISVVLSVDDVELEPIYIAAANFEEKVKSAGLIHYEAITESVDYFVRQYRAAVDYAIKVDEAKATALAAGVPFIPPMYPTVEQPGMGTSNTFTAMGFIFTAELVDALKEHHEKEKVREKQAAKRLERIIKNGLNTIGVILGQAIGAQVGGGGRVAAAGAATGAQFGTAIGGTLGMFGGPIGGLAGGIIGGLIGKKFEKPAEEMVDAIDANTDAVKANTEAILDLGRTIINAPTRYRLPVFTGDQGFGINIENIYINSTTGDPEEIYKQFVERLERDYSREIKTGYTRGRMF